MMYLHENRELFKDVLTLVSAETGYSMDIIEKDYYVTMILKILANSKYKFVFKGGTSLSKVFNVISRFSEDIDVTFEEHLGENRRKRLKYEILKPIEDELGLKIKNFERIESDKDYNHYDYYYKSVCDDTFEGLPSFVKLETALMSYAFPTETKIVSNYIYDVLGDKNKELIDKYDLNPYEMCVQSLERTYVDKIFAVCDYYLLNKPQRNSRHLYDIYMISKYVDAKMVKELFPKVRDHRLKMGEKIAPSANPKIDIKEVYKTIMESDFYKSDYNQVTSKLVLNPISYEEVMNTINEIINGL
ncbi:MAG: nucleotidyl transferase AbiEii/AbiGii toxin family protein [Acholeplasmatales bacterium]|nr:nucleotidyl transferase AbiEii/AbiGii toxin family protein [Acholeplasmatales bacterium]